MKSILLVYFILASTSVKAELTVLDFLTEYRHDLVTQLCVPGDVTNNGTVTAFDVAKILQDQGLTYEDEKWDYTRDLNRDDVIDHLDIELWIKFWNRAYE